MGGRRRLYAICRAVYFYCAQFIGMGLLGEYIGRIYTDAAPAPAILFSKLSVHPARKMIMKTVVFAYHDMGCLGIEALWLPVTKLAPFLPIPIIPVKSLLWFGGSSGSGKRHSGLCADDVNHPLWVERIAQLSPEVISLFIIAILFATRFCSSLPQGI